MFQDSLSHLIHCDAFAGTLVLCRFICQIDHAPKCTFLYPLTFYSSVSISLIVENRKKMKCRYCGATACVFQCTRTRIFHLQQKSIFSVHSFWFRRWGDDGADKYDDKRRQKNLKPYYDIPCEHCSNCIKLSSYLSLFVVVFFLFCTLFVFWGRSYLFVLRVLFDVCVFLPFYTTVSRNWLA